MHVSELRRGMWAEGDRERENLQQVLHPAWSLVRGSVSHPRDPDLSQNLELDASLTEPPRCPNTAYSNLEDHFNRAACVFLRKVKLHGVYF